MYVNETIMKASADIIKFFHINDAHPIPEPDCYFCVCVGRERRALLCIWGKFYMHRFPFIIHVFENTNDSNARKLPIRAIPSTLKIYLLHLCNA